MSSAHGDCAVILQIYGNSRYVIPETSDSVGELEWLTFLRMTILKEKDPAAQRIVRALLLAKLRWANAAPLAERQRRAMTMFYDMKSSHIPRSFRRFLSVRDVLSFSVVDRSSVRGEKMRRALAASVLRTSCKKIIQFLHVSARKAFAASSHKGVAGVREVALEETTSLVKALEDREAQCLLESGLTHERISMLQRQANIELQERLRTMRRGARHFHSAAELARWRGPLDEVMPFEVERVGNFRTSNVPSCLLALASLLLSIWRRPCPCASCSPADRYDGKSKMADDLSVQRSILSSFSSVPSLKRRPPCPYMWQHFLKVFFGRVDALTKMPVVWTKMQLHLDIDSSLLDEHRQSLLFSLDELQWALLEEMLLGATPEEDPDPLLQPSADVFSVSRFAFFTNLWLRAHLDHYKQMREDKENAAISAIAAVTQAKLVRLRREKLRVERRISTLRAIECAPGQLLSIRRRSKINRKLSKVRRVAMINWRQQREKH